MESYSISSSGDVFDSQGFNDFLNAEDSSEEDAIIRKPKMGSKNPPRPVTTGGDIYNFDIDFGNIKIPEKEPPKPKTAMKAPEVPAKKGVSFGKSRPKSPEDDDRPVISSKQDPMSRADFMKQFGESSSFSMTESEPLLSSSQASPPVDIKTEPFPYKTNAPISLKEKIEPAKEETPSVSDYTESHREETSEQPEESYEEEEEDTSHYIAQSESANTSMAAKPLTPQVIMAQQGEKSEHYYLPQQTYVAPKPRDDYPPARPRDDYPPARPRDDYPPSRQRDDFPPSRQRDDYPPSRQRDDYPPSRQRDDFPPSRQRDDYPPSRQRDEFTPVQYRDYPPRDERFVTRERQLEIEVIELRSRVKDLQEVVEIKQDQIYQLEKDGVHKNFARMEEEALEKMKLQLKEANHQIELYRIETEELIKQVDYTEGRAKDLEIQNNNVLQEMNRKERLFEERLRQSEARTAERAHRDFQDKLEGEKQELAFKTKDLELELSKYKSEVSILNGEKKELRQKLVQRRDQENRIKELELQLRNQMSTSSNKQQIEQKPSDNAHLLKEIESQELIIKGYQKENDKLVQELKNLKEFVKEEQTKLHVENRKVEMLKNTLIRDHGGVLIKENISDLQSINDLAGGTVINKNEYLSVKERARELDSQLIQVQRVASEREIELQGQIEALHKFKVQTERQGIELIQKEDKIKELQYSLDWYIENYSALQEVAAKGENSDQLVDRKEPKASPTKKPKTDENVKALESKISELQEALRTKDAQIELKMKTAEKRPPSARASANANASNLRIKELEKQVEDTKNYYIKKMNDIKKFPTQEVKHLKNTIAEKENVIHQLQSKLSQTSKPISDDFDDNNYDVEDKEDEECYQALRMLQQNLRILSSYALGTLTYSKTVEILIEAVPDLSYQQCSAFVRRAMVNGSIDFTALSRNLQEKDIDWWVDQMSKASLAMRKTPSTSTVPEWLVQLVKDKLDNFMSTQAFSVPAFVEYIFRGEDFLTSSKFRARVLELKIPLNKEDCYAITKSVPKLTPVDMDNWLSIRPENTEFLTQRIKELEGQLNTPIDRTIHLKLKSYQEENTKMQETVEFQANEIERLKLDRQRLENHIEKNSRNPGTSEFLLLQKKIEFLEDSHFRIEQDLRGKLHTMGNDRQVLELKRKHETEISGLNTVISKKNQQIAEFKVELEELLEEIENLRERH